MTPKQKGRIIMICASIIVASYAAHAVGIAALQYANYQRQVAYQQKIKEQQAQKAGPLPQDVPAKAAPPVPDVRGIWQGHTTVSGWGICDLRFEVREKEANNFTGYSKLSCFDLSAMLNPPARLSAASGANPDTAILTGTMQDGAITFRADKVFSSDINGCALNSITVTPFSGELNVEWEADACRPGHMLLQRIGK